MSTVTNIIILVPCEVLQEPHAIRGLNSWLREKDYGLLKEISDYAGGHKAMEKLVFAGAFNNFDLDTFLLKCSQQDWEEREYIQILYQLQDQDQFTMVEI